MHIDPRMIETKIHEIYPEIAQRGLTVSASFEKATGDWLVRIGKDGDEISTHIGKADAEACLAGRRCVHVAAQVGSFVNSPCGGATGCVLS
jgi:hypothetical protein